MPKQKTHKGIQKRVRATAKGKFKFRQTGRGHLLSHKSGNRKRKPGVGHALTGPIAVRGRELVPRASSTCWTYGPRHGDSPRCAKKRGRLAPP